MILLLTSPLRCALLLTLVLAWPANATGQPTRAVAVADTAAGAGVHDPHHGMAGMRGMVHGVEHAGVEHAAIAHEAGLLGSYAMTREASGTSWQPDRAAHRGIHTTAGEWTLMLHGMAHLAYGHQGGPRGGEKTYSDNMVMGMARRPLGPATLGLRAMVSAEPATIGKEGYPLLLQTGETADGTTPLVDRQHPHDLFMELATSLSLARGRRSVFLYAGLPGEPALGPPAYMHRFSGADLPQAPIGHHWLDATHISYGVLTAGATAGRVKVEASAFRGREPDEKRWDIESPKLDSHSFRLSINPTDSWSLQASHGRIESPEQLEPGVDQDRTTASAMLDGAWALGRWEATLAWGRNRNRPGRTLDAFLVEAAARLREAHTLVARAERVEKDELFRAPDPREGWVFAVGQLSAGYGYDLWRAARVAAGAGVLGSFALVPASLQGAYGKSPASVTLFVHAVLR